MNWRIIFPIAAGLIIGALLGNAAFGILLAIVFSYGANMRRREHVIHPDMQVFKKKAIIPAIIIIIVLIGLIYFFRPWFHGLFMLFYSKPPITFFVIFLVLTAVSGMFKRKVVTTVFSALMFISLITLMFTPLIEQNYIVDEMNYNKIDMLPDSDDVRVLPSAVAHRYLEDSLQKSRERVGPINIVNLDGTLSWVAPRIPDGNILYFTEKVNGLMVADATKTERETRFITDKLEVGEGIGITDNIYWQLYKERFFIDLGEIYYLSDNDSITTVVPIISYKFRFPVMIPYYAGVFTISSEGEVSYLTPEEVTKREEFRGNRAFPESLARYYVDSYKYNQGVINAWFLHKDQIEIADVYGQSNQQPFLMPTEDGLKWVIATEPYGQSYGVFKIFLVDALTGKIDMLELDEEKTLTGPVRVVSYVKKQFPIIDWSSSNIIEPRPYVIDGTLYWMLSITPRDFAGIAYTVFVNSENNNVLDFQEDNAIQEFIRGGEIIEPEKTDDTSEDPIQDKITQIEKALDELKELLNSTQQ